MAVKYKVHLHPPALATIRFPKTGASDDPTKKRPMIDVMIIPRSLVSQISASPPETHDAGPIPKTPEKKRQIMSVLVFIAAAVPIVKIEAANKPMTVGDFLPIRSDKGPKRNGPNPLP